MKFSAEVQMEMIDLYQHLGQDLGEIAELFDCTRLDVVKVLKANGVALKGINGVPHSLAHWDITKLERLLDAYLNTDRPLVDVLQHEGEGLHNQTFTRILAVLGVPSRKTSRQRLEAARRVDEEIYAMRLQGSKYREIAMSLGVSSARIVEAIWRVEARDGAKDFHPADFVETTPPRKPNQVRDRNRLR